MQPHRTTLWNRLLPFCALLLATFPVLAGTVAYTYDALNRLTRAEYGDGTVIEYYYDAAGNRTNHIIQAATTNPPGDVNSDGQVDALDVVATINDFLGTQTWPAADVNHDGSVNALDVVFVINRALGI